MTSGSEVGLGKRREFLVYAVIFVITSGSLFDIATQREHWPFSPYRMFSSVKREHSISAKRLIGVTDGDPPREITLQDPQYIQPLSSLGLSTSLNRKPNDVTYEQYYTEALRHVLDRYEALRIAGEHDGPRLRGIRLYKYHWKLDPWARNAERPDSQVLILEIMDPVKK